MQRPAHNSTTESIPPSLVPAGGGWHCSHLYYSFNRTALARFTSDERAAGSRDLVAALDPAGAEAPLRLQTTIISGHKADFGVMLLDRDPLKIDRVHQRLLAGRLGPAIEPRWSFISMTEISEYVQSPEQFGERLVAEGMNADGAEYKTRLKGYTDRLVDMNRQRLTPDFPSYPATCFYPMNKKRKVGENWFTLPKEERSRLMIEHARSGMAFAGRVSQLITVGLGLEDWEWGVTLWAANPDYLKEIVYRMRFDEASARYAEFGPFYTGYVASPKEILAHCAVSQI
jgi:hydrogen peroxide-dependent heme synthase